MLKILRMHHLQLWHQMLVVENNVLGFLTCVGGLTHHIPHDSSNFGNATTYPGNDEVLVVKGASLPITHNGKHYVSF